VLALGALSACDDGDQGQDAASEPAAAAQVNAVPDPNDPQKSDAEPGSDKDAAGIILRLRDDAERSALTLSLKATPEDYVAVWGAEFGPAVQAQLDALWASGKLRPGPWGPEQTETVIVSATKEEFDGWTGSAGKFPKGYKRIREFLQPGTKIFMFKYVRPGEPGGTSFDGLVHVNGRWRLMPKPYRAAGEDTPFYRQTAAEKVCAHLSALPTVPPEYANDCVDRMGIRAHDYGPKGFEEFAACAMKVTDIAALSTCRPADAAGAVPTTDAPAPAPTPAG
jgi:hypothetical protein